MHESATTNGDYGLDAPQVVRNLIIAGIASIIIAIVLQFILASAQPWIGVTLLICGLITGISLLVTAALMIWSSKVGKIKFREQLINQLELGGTEIVLDVGCGRGLLLTASARRLTTGKAIGIDLWQSVDQSGNHPEITLLNAKTEGVVDLVEVRTGDMRKLPFEDQTIDVVVSSLAIHNVPDKEGRAQAIREISRVLKPNGKISLLDFQCTKEYIQTLHELGWRDAKLSQLIFQIFLPVRVITGKKPA
jgi:arsenite methyltransferase